MNSLRLYAFALIATLGSCATKHRDGALHVTIIGSGFHRSDADQFPLTTPQALLTQASATGLVTLDASGQVEPALAESWIVTGDGASTIFRLRRVKWANGDDVTARDAAASLNRALATQSHNPLKPLLSAIDSIVPMTGRVVEIRLKVPRPYLLQLLAQPELGIRRGGQGTGPYRAQIKGISAIHLHGANGEDSQAGTALADVELSSDTSARAIARFMLQRVDLVLGGTLADWPLALASGVRSDRLRVDPAQGLFGLAIVGRSPFLADPDARAALAMSIDRIAMGRTLRLVGWNATEALLPMQFDSAHLPALPKWSGMSLAQRQVDAASRIARWARGGGDVPVVRVSLPPGPGMRVMLARLTTDWGRIGVKVMSVRPGSPDADVRLIDAVAPNSSANWYLTQVSCAGGLVCDSAGDAALEQSRIAASLNERATRLAQADTVQAARGSFIALGTPVRWSLVDPALTGWRENVFATHPLAELRPTAPVN